MAKLTPYIKSDDARSQAAFYVEALGGEIVQTVTNEMDPNATEETRHKVLHMTLVAGGITFFLSDFARGPLTYGNGISLAIELANAAETRTAFDKLAAGGTVVEPLQPGFWGALFGEIKDKYGVTWMLTHEVPASQA